MKRNIEDDEKWEEDENSNWGGWKSQMEDDQKSDWGRKKQTGYDENNAD
jgi:hypothetical protein